MCLFCRLVTDIPATTGANFGTFFSPFIKLRVFFRKDHLISSYERDIIFHFNDWFIQPTYKKTNFSSMFLLSLNRFLMSINQSRLRFAMIICWKCGGDASKRYIYSLQLFKHLERTAKKKKWCWSYMVMWKLSHSTYSFD